MEVIPSVEDVETGPAAPRTFGTLQFLGIGRNLRVSNPLNDRSITFGKNQVGIIARILNMNQRAFFRTHKPAHLCQIFIQQRWAKLLKLVGEASLGTWGSR